MTVKEFISIIENAEELEFNIYHNDKSRNLFVSTSYILDNYGDKEIYSIKVNNSVITINL